MSGNDANAAGRLLRCAPGTLRSRGLRPRNQKSIGESLPDLVLLDIQMPYLDGYAVLERLRSESRFRSLRVIAVTAFAMRGDREKALAAGFDGYITKPIRIADLRAQVECFLRSS